MKESNVMSIEQWRKRTAPVKKRAKAKTQEPYQDMSKYGMRAGIDPGKNTGLCIWADGEIQYMQTLAIHEAMDKVKELVSENYCLIRFEDARLRTWYGDTGKERMKGAGSVERDCAIWEDFLKDIGANYDRVHPRDVKATTADEFKELTGYAGKTSIHAREAAWMVV